MKKIASSFCLAIICLSFTINFAQSRKITPGNETGKKNQRPVESPTPPVSSNTAQQTPEENVEVDDTDVIKVDTEIVSIPVKVLDRSGRFIGGLTKENFKVLEDSIEQEIAYFSNEQQPFTVALVLDMSYSAKFKAEEIQASALAFVNQLRPNDKVMVVSFDQEVYVQCEPTNDRKILQDAIRKTKISYGTSLYEAMDLVINEKLKKITGRKAIVLFSDGVDTSSRKSTDLLNLSDTLELDALIYPIQYDTFNEVQAMKNKPIIQKPTTPNPIPPIEKSPLPFPAEWAEWAESARWTIRERPSRNINEPTNISTNWPTGQAAGFIRRARSPIFRTLFRASRASFANITASVITRKMKRRSAKNIK
jgi:Mg-chelatase subunit ChlD